MWIVYDKTVEVQNPIEVKEVSILYKKTSEISKKDIKAHRHKWEKQT